MPETAASAEPRASPRHGRLTNPSVDGIDWAKRSFQLRGSRTDGSVAFRKKLSREKRVGFLVSQPRCVVAMEACASAHHWGRELQELGYDVRLVPPIYVKPFVKRQKNDAADAEVICVAAQRPTKRFVAVKTQDQSVPQQVRQAQTMLFGVIAPTDAIFWCASARRPRSNAIAAEPPGGV